MRPFTVAERDRLHRQVPLSVFADMQVLYKSAEQDNSLSSIRHKSAVDGLFTFIALLMAQREDVLAVADELERGATPAGQTAAAAIRMCHGVDTAVVVDEDEDGE